MPCTTLLVGKLASADGSTLIARNSDSGAGAYTPKKFVAVPPEDQPRTYTSVISGVTIALPEDPMPYTCVPNALKNEGEWASAGINAANVGMTATETITSNPRVLGADPLVKNGIGEEDLVTLVLPYVKTAREGCLRLGSLLEEYGTYEMNGIGFSDEDDVWWLETIGGHHWMARRLPQDAYAVIPNQLGLDFFDFADPENFIGSADLEAFVKHNALDLRMDPEEPFNPRDAFGSHDDSDHTYNTPRAWWALSRLNPDSFAWTGPDADFTPESNDLPWCLVPEKKITVEDVKYVLSGHYQRTPYDPYLHHGDTSMAGAYRTIGINRTDYLACCQIKTGAPSIQWLAYASNPFNVMVPFYTDIIATPAYAADTTDSVSTGSFYWTSRLIAAMADACDRQSAIFIERYQNTTTARCREILNRSTPEIQAASGKDRIHLCMEANEQIAEVTREQAQKCLGEVLKALSDNMKNAFSRSDA